MKWSLHIVAVKGIKVLTHWNFTTIRQWLAQSPPAHTQAKGLGPWLLLSAMWLSLAGLSFASSLPTWLIAGLLGLNGLASAWYLFQPKRSRT